ncbi:tRNA 5-methylaminomethyl-2-thiouridine biosynthesis bifunctional protein MnmC [mine drainage metagenome]|uniref:tRNA 5-methylaminomethyl-2-thiouridine biosynthesis bifunctional protein MnmC n=1 Tax=mine drainage metagenome TaxID=410659 RepID=A0A1J5SV72_9ZZZZ
MKRAVVIGGGIAGCSTAHALAKRGIQVTLFERHATLGNEASGNPCAMLYPRLSGNNDLSEFALAGYLYSLSLFKSLHFETTEFNNCGMLQLGFNAREMARIQKVAASYTDTNILRYTSQQEACQLAGMKIQYDALYFPNAGWIKPTSLYPQITQHKNISVKTLTSANKILKINDIFHIYDSENRCIEAEIVVIANANHAKDFQQSVHIATQAVRGQISLLDATPLSQNLNTIVCSDGYLSPVVDGQHSLGATYSIENTALTINAEDHLTNFHTLHLISEQLHQDLLQKESEHTTVGRVALRCTTPDYFPLLGQLLDVEALQSTPPRPNADTGTLPWQAGLYINAAHGSKGFTSAPLCAELLAALICNEPLPISETLAAQLNPNRFILREMGLKRLAKTIAISS